ALLGGHSSTPAVASASPRPSPTPTATLLPTSTPSPATPSAATAADLATVADALFPQTEGGGRQTCFLGDTTFAQCPVTARLRAALTARATASPGGGADPICGCQSVDSQTAFTFSPNAVTGGGTIHVSAFAGSTREDIVVVTQNGTFLADDIRYCTASPPAGVYPGEAAGC
nr:hypothetical protein [Candidatus Dormibacteraeota bacterium]